ncbi:histidine--tRNA ligase [Enterobacteriaceae endosymbiont of Neohaemonia nigricornis]|uniref:histidine--tRNA ligase n=1 Tax=Enterobacteriaceae endosymbiont of Neohaemonia nigricornis TaxID=2675792 RepID=UPI001448DA9F|nr:histidine--tRNA ligase [Enterobacteriaceae endosymbiont of Neohaemonia nigricornis]QJC30246.1 histidine--tRNA ligase [Enterobacteriaceae endosymbiont of Neohaemonia nigricornis]
MSTTITSIYGMHDHIFPDTILWEFIETKIKNILKNYGYYEIKIPIVEKQQLFQQTIGEYTDIITKEMYNLYDKNGEILTLRPEGTTGCIRAIIENNLLYSTNNRLWYIGPMFRYERPQQGRYRQFYQIGIETFGLPEPYIDCEIIIITYNIWKKLNIIDYVALEINSIGSITIRQNYINQLILFLKNNIHLLDSDSINKINTNPLRILDSKNYNTQQLLIKAPKLEEYLDEKSINNFNKLCQMLKKMNIKFNINNNLIRGLDYYNDIVFEWTTKNIGASKTICGGGRYNDLIKKMSCKNDINGMGCAIGIERVLLLIKKVHAINFSLHNKIDICLIPMTNDHILYQTIQIREKILNHFPHLKIIISYFFSNIKKQIIKAIKYNTHFVFIIGIKEIKTQTITIKDLYQKKQINIPNNKLIIILSDLLNNK